MQIAYRKQTNRDLGFPLRAPALDMAINKFDDTRFRRCIVCLFQRLLQVTCWYLAPSERLQHLPLLLTGEVLDFDFVRPDAARLQVILL